MTWFELRKEDLSFLRRAPVSVVCDGEVEAPRTAIFAALADPGTWSAWFPGVRRAWYPSPAPYGVGTIREAEVGGTRWVEELIAWEADLRWAYTVTRASVPIAWAQVESFELEARGRATRVTWTLACEPRLLMRLGAPAAPRVIRRVFARALENLGRYLG